MAGPLREMLYRRPVRNAIRSLLGMQPRYGYGMGDPMERLGMPGQQEADDVSVRAASKPASALPATAVSQTPSLGVGTTQPPLEPPAAPASGPVAPVAQAASLIATPPNAMAQAKEQAEPDMAALFPRRSAQQSQDAYKAVIDQFRAPIPGMNAPKGVLATVPMVGTPATTERPVAVDPAASQIAALREQDMQRAAAKRRQAEGLSTPTTATAVSQTAPQEAARATLDAPAPGAQTPDMMSDQYLMQQAMAAKTAADQIQSQMNAVATKHRTAKTPLEQSAAMLEYQALSNQQSLAQGSHMAYIQTLESRAARREAARLQGDAVNRQYHTDTPTSNLQEVEQLTERVGMDAAVAAVTNFWRNTETGRAATPADVAAFQNQQMLAAAPVALAQRIRGNARFSGPDDPMVRSIAGIAKANAQTPQDRDRVIQQIVVGSLQRMGVRNPQVAIQMTAALSRLVEQRIAEE